MTKTTRKDTAKETCSDLLEKCQKMAEMMKNCCGGEESSFDCCEKMQKMQNVCTGSSTSSTKG